MNKKTKELVKEYLEEAFEFNDEDYLYNNFYDSSDFMCIADWVDDNFSECNYDENIKQEAWDVVFSLTIGLDACFPENYKKEIPEYEFDDLPIEKKKLIDNIYSNIREHIKESKKEIKNYVKENYGEIWE